MTTLLLKKQSFKFCLISHNCNPYRGQSWLDIDPNVINPWFDQNRVLPITDAVGSLIISSPHSLIHTLCWQHPAINTCHFLREANEAGWVYLGQVPWNQPSANDKQELKDKYPTSLPVNWDNSEEYSTLSPRVAHSSNPPNNKSFIGFLPVLVSVPWLSKSASRNHLPS